MGWSPEHKTIAHTWSWGSAYMLTMTQRSVVLFVRHSTGSRAVDRHSLLMFMKKKSEALCEAVVPPDASVNA